MIWWVVRRSGGIRAGMARRKDSVCEDFQEKPWIGRTAPRVGDGKNKLQKRNVHLKYTHIEEIQHYTDLSLQETWPAHTEKRSDQDLDKRCRSSLKKNKEWKKEASERKKNRRPISKSA